MYTLECSSNYSDTTASLWFYCEDEALKSFKYKAELFENNKVAQPTPNQNNGFKKKKCKNCYTIKISK